MKEKTSDYDMFIFRDDNREKINQGHVITLIESIRSCNMLELRPILVNEHMEIIDGQHRLLAAKSLGVPIFYTVEKTITPRQVMLLNINKQWTIGDYLNFYVKHGYPEYKKLEQFIRMNQLTLRVALHITIGSGHEGHIKFKDGDFAFDQQFSCEELQMCRDTQAFIKKSNGYFPYTESAKFWKAMLFVIKNEKFDFKKWMSNLSKMSQRICVKARYIDYVKLLVDIYNYRNNDKILFTGGLDETIHDL